MFWRRNRQGLAIVALAMLLIVGETVGFLLPALSSLWPWTACLFALAVCIVVGWQTPAGRYLLVPLLGLTLAWRSEDGRLTLEQQGHRLRENGLPPTFDLRVESEVLRRCRPRQGGWTISFESHIEGIAVKVVAPVRQDGQVPSLGEVWRCAGWLSLKKSAPTRYARRTLWVMEEDHLVRIAEAKRSAMMFYRRISERLSGYVGTGLGWCPELAAFNRAMLLGLRTEVPAGRRKAFAAAGTMHVFAISGLHVMLIAGLLRVLLAKTGLPPKACAACVLPILWAYVMLSGARPSAVRAALMMSLWMGAGLFERKADGLAAWGHAAFLVYSLSPALIFDAGCALSFMVMLGIALWLRWSSQFATPLDWMRRIAAREQALGADRRAERIVVWQGLGLRILGGLGISFAAWIASAPLMARVFENLTLGGLVANVVVVPLAGIAVVLGAAGMVASMMFTPLGAFFNNLSALCTWTMAQISEGIAHLPGVAVETQPWSWCDCCLWYVAWLMLFAVLARHLPAREWIPIKTWRGEDDHGMA